MQTNQLINGELTPGGGEALHIANGCDISVYAHSVCHVMVAH